MAKEDFIEDIEINNAGFESFSTSTTAKARGEILRKRYELTLQHKDDLEAQGKGFYGVSFISWFAEEATRSYGDDPQESLNILQSFNSDPNVFILLAHDSILFDVLSLFNNHPDLGINDWTQKGHKSQNSLGIFE
ncbi:hypothetical protein PENANT_c024G09783 [Penicillium antarcticum]|uniref:Uncharacterized protein n=1 Tax=Penicillium antarcticum TaxID=416450 RepID=A0A1V6PY51_9EURO|nr:hypothetical protein PENANT_c024G09783 [Penicillium antarcticum]